MIIDRIGRQEVLSPINHNYNKIGDILVFFVIKTQETATVFLLAVKASHVRARTYVWGHHYSFLHYL